ncbi:MAG: Zn-ribbon domain-containing OB-fold protein [Thermoplasmata archaeon]
MDRSIVSGSVVRPDWRRGAVDAQGPDEDAFTLAVDALDREPNAPSVPGTLDALHLVGPTDPAQDWAFREALGRPQLEVHHHRSGASSFVAALASAAHAGGSAERIAVVAIDLAAGAAGGGSRPTGAGAVAVRFGPRPGVRVEGYGQRAHPSERRPNASEWTAAAAQVAGGFPEAAQGELLLLSEAAPPVLAAAWTKRHPEAPCRTEPLPTHVGGSDGIGMATRLLELIGRITPGKRAIIARVEPDWTDYLAVACDASVPLPEAAAAPTRELPSTSFDHPIEGLRLDRVSEGAYVPYATYRENLPSRWRFAALHCGACQKITFPVRPNCRYCGASEGRTIEELPRDGALVEAVTTVRPGAQPTEFDDQVAAVGAYDVVLARVAPGVRVTLQVAGMPPGSVRVGDLVDTRLRRLYPMEGEWRYGRKAKIRPRAPPST